MAINIIDSFKLNNPLPLDSKYIVKDAAALSTLISDNTSYAGLLCYEIESKTLYILEQNGLGLLAKALFVNGVAQETAGDNVATEAQEKIFKLQVALGLEKLADTGNDSVNIITRLANLEDDNAETRLTNLENIQAGTRLSSLEELHAKGKTVANEVAEGIAKVVANAPKDFDTLKEVADWIQSDTSGAAKMQADIYELQNKVGTTNVPTQITNAVNKLDATVGSTTIASGKHVAVEIVQTDGKLTSATVTEDDIASAAALKSVSDLVGTVSVPTQISNAINKLDVAVGSTTVPTGKHVAVQVIETDGKLVSATVTESDIASAAGLKAVSDLVGTTSVPTQITNAVNALDATVRSNMDSSDIVTAEQKVGIKVVETDGKLTSVLIKTNDIASAATLKSVSDLVGTTGVATQITNAINGLDATVRSNMDTADAVTAAQKVGVKVVETDGKLSSVLVKTNDIASAATLKSVSDLVGSTAVSTQITNAINGLDATVRSNMDTSDAVTAAQKVGVKVVETDGKLTSVLVKTNDIASAASLKSVSDLVGSTAVSTQISNAINNHSHSNYLGAVTANGYTGMAKNDGNTSDWIRTTSAGIIPYQSGSAGSGHCGLGTSSWYFSTAYIDTVNSVKTYGAVWNDYAELFPRAEGDDETTTEPGDLIAYDYAGTKEGYRRATDADDFVVGVYTDEFAHLIGGDMPQGDMNLLEYNLPRYIPVSLAGRVWVNLKPGTVAKCGQYVIPSDIPGKGIVQDKRSENSVGRIVALDLDNNRARIKVFC